VGVWAWGGVGKCCCALSQTSYRGRGAPGPAALPLPCGPRRRFVPAGPVFGPGQGPPRLFPGGFSPPFAGPPGIRDGGLGASLSHLSRCFPLDRSPLPRGCPYYQLPLTLFRPASRPAKPGYPPGRQLTFFVPKNDGNARASVPRPGNPAPPAGPKISFRPAPCSTRKRVPAVQSPPRRGPAFRVYQGSPWPLGLGLGGLAWGLGALYFEEKPLARGIVGF